MDMNRRWFLTGVAAVATTAVLPAPQLFQTAIELIDCRAAWLEDAAGVVVRTFAPGIDGLFRLPALREPMLGLVIEGGQNSIISFLGPECRWNRLEFRGTD